MACEVSQDDQIGEALLIGVVRREVMNVAAEGNANISVMVLARLPSIVSGILTLCLDYFKKNLLEWIRKVGGWMYSIPALACFSFEQFSGSSLRKHFPHFGAAFSFTCGLLLGGFIISRLHKS